MATKVPDDFASQRRFKRESKQLFADKTCSINEAGDIRHLDLNVGFAWTDKTAALAKRYKVNGVHVYLTAAWKNKTLDFLSRIPDLKTLNLCTREMISWNTIESFFALEELSLSSDSMFMGNDRFAISPAPAPSAIDFTKLKNLRSCRINWSSSWASVLKVKWLKELEIRDDTSLAELDCSDLDSLEELTLPGLFKLKNILLNDRAKLKRLYLNGVPKLNPDWRRLGRDLERLTIVSKIASPWEEIRHARNLWELNISYVKNLGSVQFLKDLSKLYFVSLGAKLCKEDDALIEEINKQALADWKKRQATRPQL